MGATIFPANVSQVQLLQCDFYDGRHANENCVPKGHTKEFQIAGSFQRGNPDYNTHDAGWKNRLNFKWGNN